MLAMRGAPWRADLLWIVDWIPIGHFAIAPVIAGAAAIDTARLSVGARHLEGARWWRSTGAAVTLAYSVGVGGTYVVSIVGAALVEVPPSLDPRVLLAAGVQVLMLTLFAAVGMVIGRLAPPVIGSVVSAIVALVATYMLSARSEHIVLLYAGASLVSRVGRSYNVTYLGSQAALLSVLVLALLMIRPGVLRSRWRRAGERSVAVTAVGMLLVAGSVGPSSRLTYTGKQPTLCSDVSGVKVCLFPEHRRIQGEVNAQLARLFDAAHAAGYDALVPPEIRESAGGEPDWPGPWLDFDEELAGAPVDLRGLVMGIVEPFWCEGRGGEESPSERYWGDARAVKGTWLELVSAEEAAQWGYYYRHVEPEEAAVIIGQFRTCTYPFR